MLSEEVLDKVIERLVRRIEQGNEYILINIGNKIDEIGKLQPTQAMQLKQIFRYGGDYDKIVNKLSQISKLNKRDIQKIFREYRIVKMINMENARVPVYGRSIPHNHFRIEFPETEEELDHRLFSKGRYNLINKKCFSCPV